MTRAFTDLGKSPYAFVDTNAGCLGSGTEDYAVVGFETSPFASLYGPGQSSGVHQAAGLPYTGLNKRDFITQAPVSDVTQVTVLNSLRGNGAYFHGVITLQDLLNVQAATGTHNGG